MPSPGFWLGLGNALQTTGQGTIKLEQQNYDRQQQAIINALNERKFQEEQQTGDEKMAQFIAENARGGGHVPPDIQALFNKTHMQSFMSPEQTLASTPGPQAAGYGSPSQPQAGAPAMGPQDTGNMLFVPTEPTRARIALEQLQQRSIREQELNRQAYERLSIQREGVTGRNENASDRNDLMRMYYAAMAAIGGQNAKTNATRVDQTGDIASVKAWMKAKEDADREAMKQFPPNPMEAFDPEVAKSLQQQRDELRQRIMKDFDTQVVNPQTGNPMSDPRLNPPGHGTGITPPSGPSEEAPDSGVHYAPGGANIDLSPISGMSQGPGSASVQGGPQGPSPAPVNQGLGLTANVNKAKAYLVSHGKLATPGNVRALLALPEAQWPK